MYRLLVALFVIFSVFENINACCCFRDAWMLTPQCGCPDFYTPCGVVTCPSCANVGSSLCDCGLPICASYRDTSNVCYVPDTKVSPICSCLKAVNDCDCACEEIRSFIYFPEVEYPTMTLEMKPFYYSSCWNY